MNYCNECVKEHNKLEAELNTTKEVLASAKKVVEEWRALPERAFINLEEIEEVLNRCQ